MIAVVDEIAARTLRHCGQGLGASRREASERIGRCVLRGRDENGHCPAGVHDCGWHAHVDTPHPCCESPLVSNFAFLGWMGIRLDRVYHGIAAAALGTLHHPRQ